jgi:hypothetical protein
MRNLISSRVGAAALRVSLLGCVMAGSFPADLFNEVGDAGGLLGNAAVSGAGALTQIMGHTRAGRC